MMIFLMLQNFQLLINFVEVPNKIVDLTKLDMLDLEDGLLRPESLGLNQLDIYFNGFISPNPLN